MRLGRLSADYMLWLDGEALGGSEQILSRTVEYVGQRRQFGVPVGSFQAVKHSLANAYAELELARGHAYDAAGGARAKATRRRLPSRRAA